MSLAWPLAQPQQLRVNGVDLAQYAAIAETLAGLQTLPAKRGENFPIQSRHGSVRAPRKHYDQRELVLPLWVKGANPDGTVPTASVNQVAALYARADALSRLFGGDTVVIEHTQPDGTARTLTAEVLEVVDFTRNLGRRPALARVSVALVAAYPFWADTVDTTVGPFALATNGTRQMVEFAASTAPMDELRVTFGPGNNPVLTVVESDVLIAYDGVIGASQSLTLNAGTWEATTTGGLVFDRTLLRTDPREGRWWVLDPVLGGATVRLDHTGGGTMNVTIAGRRKWLLG